MSGGVGGLARAAVTGKKEKQMMECGEVVPLYAGSVFMYKRCDSLVYIMIIRPAPAHPPLPTKTQSDLFILLLWDKRNYQHN